MCHLSEWGPEMNIDDNRWEFKKLRNIVSLVVGILGVGIGLFHLYTGAFGIFEAYLQRILHLLTLMIFVYLTFPGSKKFSEKNDLIISILLACLVLTIEIYILRNYSRLLAREWYYGRMLPFDYIFGVFLILLVLEATRRVVGLALPIIAVLFIIYAFVGNLLPYPFTIIAPPFSVFVDHMFLTTQAIFGIPVGVSATFVFLFILFGAFLNATKGGAFIIDFSMSLVGRATGGPAKVAIIASALFGTVSGHSVANAYGTGTFTIPLMKRMGYKPEFAAAVEAAASAGGQIMPPIMGAAAFVMAEILGVNYLEVCKAGLIPALLYFLAVFASTHVEALKNDLRGVSKEETEPIIDIVKRGFHFFIPIIVLVAVLFLGYTPFRAAFLAIIVLIAVAQVFPHTRLNLSGFYAAFLAGAKNGAVIAVSCACAGIIVGVLDVTGLGIRFVTIVTQLSGGIFPVALVLVMIACMILGMGIPTTPAYIIAAMVAGPTLIQFGVEPIAAHMFAFYSALLSAITPPVAMAAYAAASIAGADFMKTGVQASKLGFVKFLIPYIFVYNTSLLMIGSAKEILWSSVTAAFGTLLISMGIEGYLFAPIPTVRRMLYIAAGVLTLIPELYTDILGLCLCLFLIWRNYLASKSAKYA